MVVNVNMMLSVINQKGGASMPEEDFVGVFHCSPGGVVFVFVEDVAGRYGRVHLGVVSGLDANLHNPLKLFFLNRLQRD